MKSALQLKAGTTICVNTDTMLIAGLVRYYRRCDDGSVHTAWTSLTFSWGQHSDNSGSERPVDRIRRRLAEFVVGRPIERSTGLGDAIPWAFSGTVSEKNDNAEA